MDNKNNLDYTDHFPLLSELQIKALPYFILPRTEFKSCQEAGIDKTTFYDWKRYPPFAAALRELSNRKIEAAVQSLKSVCEDCVITMVEIMNCPKTTKAIKLRAANDLLGHLTKWKEIEDLDMRIAALEKIAKNGQ